jgi:hypothetical protein
MVGCFAVQPLAPLDPNMFWRASAVEDPVTANWLSGEGGRLHGTPTESKVAAAWTRVLPA